MNEERTLSEKLDEIVTAMGEVITDLSIDNSEALDKLDELANREYRYQFDNIVTVDSDTIYQSIITENPELTSVSAVGIVALLKDLDKVSKHSNSRLFINGYEKFSDYVFHAEDTANATEYITVWYFTDGVNTPFTIPADNINKIEVNIKTLGTIAPSFETGFYNYIYKLKYNVQLTSAPSGFIHTQECLDTGDIQNDKINSNVYEYITHATKYVKTNSTSPLANKANLKKIVAPNLYEMTFSVGSNNGSWVYHCSNLKEINMPNLYQTIGNSIGIQNGYELTSNLILTIPEATEKIGQSTFTGAQKIILNCKNAISIHSNWNGGTQCTQFEMCNDWGAEINISAAAANWEIVQYTDLIKKLRELEAGTHKSIIIPNKKIAVAEGVNQYIYDYLDENYTDIEGYENYTWIDYAAEIKNWIVGAG